MPGERSGSFPLRHAQHFCGSRHSPLRGGPALGLSLCCRHWDSAQLAEARAVATPSSSHSLQLYLSCAWADSQNLPS